MVSRSFEFTDWGIAVFVTVLTVFVLFKWWKWERPLRSFPSRAGSDEPL